MHSPYWRENLNKFLNGHHEVRYEKRVQTSLDGASYAERLANWF